MSAETAPTADVSAPVLGAPVAPNGAAGAQVPAVPPVPPAIVKPDVPGQVAADAAKKELDAKAAADAAAVEKKAADEKAATESKAAAEKKAADDKTAADKAWSEWKPAAPKGVNLDEGEVKQFSTAAREAGLSPDQAQKMLDFSAKVESARGVATTEKLNVERRGWLGELKADKELGGEKWNDTVVVANRALERFADEGTRKFLIATGLDAHPGLVRAFHKIGLALKDDSIGRDGMGGQGPTASDQQRAMYPNSPGMFPR